jgi:hypothetical protein
MKTETYKNSGNLWQAFRTCPPNFPMRPPDKANETLKNQHLETQNSKVKLSMYLNN